MSKTTIKTIHGRYFDITKPFEFDYNIEEIAHALSNACRFTGHANNFYSVAQHSVFVSRMCPPGLALAGLMHDASEAFLGDVATPLKRLLPDYLRIEESVELAIAAKFGLPHPLPAEVREVDRRMLMTEKRTLLTTDEVDADHWPEGEPYDFDIRPLYPKEAKALFMERYYELARAAMSPDMPACGDWDCGQTKTCTCLPTIVPEMLTSGPPDTEGVANVTRDEFWRGGVKYVAQTATKRCDGCEFHETCGVPSYCGALRDDNREVIWVKAH